MKVTLINPSRAHEIEGNNPTIIDEERGINPPLGVLYLAGELLRRNRHAVEVLDVQAERLDYPQLESRLSESAPDVVGITAMTLTLLDVVKTIATVQAACPRATVVLGGPHVHLFPEETLGLEGVDYLVLGEGETVFADLVDALDDGADLSGIPGLAYRQKGQMVTTGATEHIADLDGLAFPARALTHVEKYNSLLSAGNIVTTIFTSRGCPFRCRFCDRPHLGHRFRARSPSNVVDEIAQCVELGVREFLVYDDTFTVDKNRSVEICEEILRRKLRIRFDIRARVDTIDEPVLDALRAAGCAGIHYGVEAGHQEILDRLGKGITLEQVERAFTLTRKRRIPILAYFMIGNPGETREHILQSFRVQRQLRPDYLHMTILTPFPGTEIYREALAEGIIKSDVWREFAREPKADFVPPVWEEHLNRKELQELLKQGYKSFYVRPAYIARRILKVRSLGELKKKARAGLKVFKMS